MKKNVLNILGPLYTPIKKCGEQLGNILADTIEKVLEEIKEKMKSTKVRSS